MFVQNKGNIKENVVNGNTAKHKILFATTGLHTLSEI